jgi:molybdenum cofactor cytidylyltransferase
VGDRSIAAVILAAGQSQRMGQPKMLLPWGKTTVLGQVLGVFAETLETDWKADKQIIVVTGGARAEVEELVGQLALPLSMACVFNPAYATGEMLTSLQVGLAALGPEVAAALIGLGDQPQVSLNAARKVLAACEATDARLIIPSFQLRRGHPWLVRRDLWPEILNMRPPATLRDFLNVHAGEITYVQTDATILKDLDTPEDYRREKP